MMGCIYSATSYSYQLTESSTCILDLVALVYIMEKDINARTMQTHS